MATTRFFICKEGSSNKFWQYTIDGAHVHKKWGRIGANRFDEQEKHYRSHAEAEREISKEVSKKLGKGYVETDQDQLEHESTTAELLGDRYKIEEIQFISSHQNGQIYFGDQYDPHEGVFVTIMNSWSKDRFYVKVSKSESQQYVSASPVGDSVRVGRASVPQYSFVQGIKNAILALQAQVVEVLKTVRFAAVGSRDLDLGIDMPADPGSVNTIVQRVLANNSGASSQVVQKFAAMGERMLDL